MILPGATLGMLGGGQLGRMFTVAARTMGYEVIVLDPDPDSPAGKLATEHLRADYEDTAALEYMGHTCAVITTEFENVPAATLATLERRCPVRPSAAAVATAQDRICEKSFLRDAGFATAPFAVIRCEADLEAAIAHIGVPSILKVSRLGYDGKGQLRIEQADDARYAFAALRHEPCVLERRIDLEREISVVLARRTDGQIAIFPPAENQHCNGILDISIVPARVGSDVASAAQNVACAIAARLHYVGVLAVEFFLARDGQLLVNEIAPRPHNSGHFTIDACATSQFEQQVRAVCDLTLGDTRLFSPVVMVNLIGDQWPDQGQPDWATVLREATAKLHLYGKRAARPGRKMGHYCVLDVDPNEALARALAIKAALTDAAS